MTKDNSWLEHNAPASTPLEQALDAAYTARPSAATIERVLAAVRQTLATQAGPPKYYDLVQDTPLGPLWIAVGEQGLLTIEYESSEDSLRAYLHKLGGQPLRSSERVAAATEQVRLYLLGDTHAVPAARAAGDAPRAARPGAHLYADRQQHRQS